MSVCASAWVCVFEFPTFSLALFMYVQLVIESIIINSFRERMGLLDGYTGFGAGG